MKIDGCDMEKFRSAYSEFCSGSDGGKCYRGSVDPQGRFYLAGGEGRGKNSSAVYEAHAEGTAVRKDGRVELRYSIQKSKIFTASLWLSSVLFAVSLILAFILYGVKKVPLYFVAPVLLGTVFVVMLAVYFISPERRRFGSAIKEIAELCRS